MFTKNFYFAIAIATSAMMLSGCELIGDIFQAGLVVGLIIVVVIVAIIGLIFKKFRG